MGLGSRNAKFAVMEEPNHAPIFDGLPEQRIRLHLQPFWRGFGLPGGLTPGSFESAPPGKVRPESGEPRCGRSVLVDAVRFGLLPVFFAFFTGLAFFADGRLTLGSGAPVGAFCSDSIVLVLMRFSLTGLRS